ncbi:MAG: M48 family metallopeptidase [Phycisphaerales bacterium]
MVQVLLIAVFVVLFLRQSLARPLIGGLDAATVAWLHLGGVLALAVVMQGVLWVQGRRLDRRGSAGSVRTADLAVLVTRIAAVALHAFAVLGLGWLDVVRWKVGNLVLVDELLAGAPVLLLIALGWWSMYPIDRRLREAALIRDLDEGRMVRPMPSRGAYLLNALRHQAALIVVPVILITAWIEAAGFGLSALGSPAWFPMAAAQILGMAVVLTMMPLVMRRVWHTERLGPGPLRERLTDMCRRQGVRIRELLVWGTHGTMINGAVMGFFGPVRYILLTDALLESLPTEQVEAVMAHEIAHVKRRHMLWLAVSAIASITLVQAGLLVGAAYTLGRGVIEQDVWQAGTAVASLLAGLVVFGYVSRRFEWQADAFAVQHLSAPPESTEGSEGVPLLAASPPRSSAGVVITPAAVDAMSGALDLVARLNRIPRRRFTWRHGSIASRQERLARLPGQRADRLAVDRQVRRIKLVAAAAFLGAVAIVVASEWPRVSEQVHALRQDARHR